MELVDRIRASRVTIGDFSPLVGASTMTVYLGLYNAGNFFDEIYNNLIRQNEQFFPIVIVDNQSKDGTWDFVKELVLSLKGRAIGIRNPTNLGGTGSLWSNMDLIPTDWFATMHQDDVYFDNHVSSLIELTKNSWDTTALVSTSMAKFIEDRQKIGLVPRSNWLLGPSPSRIDLFLANLRNHSVPFPAAAFRKSAIWPVNLAWHDTSFPDTELVLRLLSDFDIKLSEEITMAYRENPLSESHSLSSESRVSGQERALTRIFLSMEFIRLASTVSFEDRNAFFQHALESINHRLNGSDRAERVCRVLAEILAINWNYDCSVVNEFLLECYRDEKYTFGADFFKGLAGSIEDRDNFSTASKWPLGKSQFEDKRTWVKRPSHLKKSFMKLLIKIAVLLRLRKDFDFKWRR